MYAYTKIMLSCLFDTVAKQVHYCLVLGVCDEDFENWMMRNMSDTEIGMCLADDRQSKRKRSEIHSKLVQFEEGLKLLGRVRIY